MKTLLALCLLAFAVPALADDLFVVRPTGTVHFAGAIQNVHQDFRGGVVFFRYTSVEKQTTTIAPPTSEPVRWWWCADPTPAAGLNGPRQITGSAICVMEKTEDAVILNCLN